MGKVLPTLLTMHYVIATILSVILTFCCGQLAHRFLLPVIHRALGRAKSADLRGVDAGPIIMTPTIIVTLIVMLFGALSSKRERAEGARRAASAYAPLVFAPVMPAGATVLVALNLRFGFRERRRRQFLIRDSVIVTTCGEQVEARSFRIAEQYWQTDAFHGHFFYTIDLCAADGKNLVNSYVCDLAAAEDVDRLKALGVTESGTEQ